MTQFDEATSMAKEIVRLAVCYTALEVELSQALIDVEPIVRAAMALTDSKWVEPDDEIYDLKEAVRTWRAKMEQKP